MYFSSSSSDLSIVQSACTLFATSPFTRIGKLTKFEYFLMTALTRAGSANSLASALSVMTILLPRATAGAAPPPLPPSPSPPLPPSAAGCSASAAMVYEPVLRSERHTCASESGSAERLSTATHSPTMNAE